MQSEVSPAFPPILTVPTMHRVCITDCLPGPATLEERELAGLAQVQCLLASHHQDLNGQIENADALIVYHEISLPAETIHRLQRCKVIVRGGVGFDNVDLAAAAQRGIPVCNVPDYGVDEVADHALALALALNRGLPRVERQLRPSLTPWDKRAVEPVARLAGRTFGILGLGRIGAATAARAKAFRMRVIACDPYLRPGLEKALDVPLVDFDTLLRESDILSLHTPLTHQTRHLLDANALSRMKPSAMLVNTSRGAVVDVDALADALESGRLFGAGIDVLPIEPATADCRLVRLWQETRPTPINLILTPHTAYYSESGLEEIRVKSAQEVGRALRGLPLRNVVSASSDAPTP